MKTPNRSVSQGHGQLSGSGYAPAGLRAFLNLPSAHDLRVCLYVVLACLSAVALGAGAVVVRCALQVF